MLGAYSLEVLLAALFLFIGLLGSLGSLGLVLALGKCGIPCLVGDDRGIQATALKDGQLMQSSSSSSSSRVDSKPRS